MKVSVKTLREQIAMLKETVRIDWTQATNETERKSTVKVLKSLASDLNEMFCNRTTKEDLERCQEWLTKSADICVRYFEADFFVNGVVDEVMSMNSMRLV